MFKFIGRSWYTLCDLVTFQSINFNCKEDFSNLENLDTTRPTD